MKGRTLTSRSFRGSYYELYQQAINTASLMQLDAEMFSRYGVTSDDLNIVNELIKKVGSRDIDEEYRFTLKLKTNEKENARDEVLKLLIDLEILISEQVGRKSIIYKFFDISNVRKLKDEDLSAKAMLCYNLLINRSMANFDLDIEQSFLDAFPEKVAKFRTLTDEQNYWVKQRSLASYIRNEPAYELSEKINEIRQIGKKMWAFTDVSRSNAYKVPKRRKPRKSKNNAPAK